MFFSYAFANILSLGLMMNFANFYQKKRTTNRIRQYLSHVRTKRSVIKVFPVKFLETNMLFKISGLSQQIGLLFPIRFRSWEADRLPETAVDEFLAE